MPGLRAEIHWADVAKWLRNRWLERTIFVLGCIVFVLLAGPMPVFLGHYWSGGDVDMSWSMVNQRAAALGWRFGHDIILTYGPLGMLASYPIYDPIGYPAKVTWCSLFALGIAASSALHFHKTGLSAWLWLLLVWPIAVGLRSCPELLVQSAPMFLFGFYLDSKLQGKRSTPAIAILCVLCGTALCSKLTLGVAVGLATGYITIDMLIAHKRLPWPALVVVGSGIAAWVLCRQRLGDLVPYVVNSLEVMSGYREMAFYDATFQMQGVVWLITAVLFLWRLWRSLRFHLRPFECLSTVFVTALLMFLIFKHAFVRFDGPHFMWGILELSVLMGVLALVVKWKGSWLSWIILFCVANLLSMTRLAKDMTKTGTMLVDRVQAIAAFPSGKSSAQVNYAEMKETVTTLFPLPPLKGSVDLYSSRQSMILCSDYDYRPRPVIQSYFAFTPKLAEMNAAYVRDRGTQHVLLKPEPIDSRFPALEDGLSWPELLRWYDVRPEIVFQFAVLDRRTQPYTARFKPLADREVPLGKPIILPDTGGLPIWVEIDIPETATRSIASLLYKESTFSLKVFNSHHFTYTYRFIPLVAKSGFLLSPIVSSAYDFKSLDLVLKGSGRLPFARPVVNAIQIDGGITSPATCRIKVYTFELEKPK